MSDSAKSSGKQPPDAQTLRRGLSILRLLARTQPKGLRVSDIGRRLGLPKATAIRLAQALVDEMFISHDASTKCYQLGAEAYAIGIAAEPTYELQRLAAPALRLLAFETGDWVCFSVLEGDEAICLSLNGGDGLHPPSALRVGDRYPLGVSSAGLAMLAALCDSEVDRILTIHGAFINRTYPQLQVEAIRGLVVEAREKGYALIPGLLLPGCWAMGAPLLRSDGRPIGAVSLITKESRLDPMRRIVLGERMIRLCRDLMSQAEQLLRSSRFFAT